MRNLSYFYNLPWGNLIAKIWGILLSTYTFEMEEKNDRTEFNLQTLLLC